MGDRSGIEWCDATWNPVVGCSQVSPGCQNCYAETQSVRNQTAGISGYEDVTERDENGKWHWTSRVNVAPDDRFRKPVSWTRPRRIFVNSMSDLFHDNVSLATIIRVFAMMADCPQHTFQMLTKRPQRMKAIMPRVLERVTGGDVLPNLWLGVSVETQAYAFRCRLLLETPAAVRWVSAEPLLGPLDLGMFMEPPIEDVDRVRLDWVVVGGESGVGARPMSPTWARTLRNQCRASETPFLFKQWGSWCPVKVLEDSGYEGDVHVTTVDDGLIMARPRTKHDAGRMLDGRLWDQYPETLPA